ncbi:MAG: prepilin peptidase [bacterium]|nr:prepilin peptidase [bacterium]
MTTAPSGVVIMTASAVFLLGACIGSFLNVVIHRLPRGESIVSPRSRCPGCGRAIRSWENIPMASFIALRGKCAGCGGAISLRYPAVEALTAAGFVAIFLLGSHGFPLLRDLLFFSLLVPIAFIDIDHRIIPDELSLGGLAAGLFLSFLPGGDWKGSVAGAVLGGGILYATAFLYEKIRGAEGMGGGDIKLLAMIGAFVGWRGTLVTIFFGALLGAVGGMLAMRKGGEGLKTAVPFGPYLCAAALMARYLDDVFLTWVGIIY